MERPLLQRRDLQSIQFNESETNIHKEKVARREIGTLTTIKTLGRQPLFIEPSNPEKLVRYIRISTIKPRFEDVIEPGIRGLFTENYVEPLCE
ncbi:hypothetical protein I4U23_028059 [Adineta vaga]|nr:hypothetical protein I4U23_028059 [Adineta vaga]